MSTPRLRHFLRPSKLTLWLAAFGVVLGIVPSLFGVQFWVFWAAWQLLLSAAVVADLVLARPPRQISAELHAPAAMHLENPGLLDLELRGLDAATKVEVHLDVDGEVELVSQDPIGREELAQAHPELTKAAARTRCLRFSFDLKRRGQLSCTALWLRWQGPLGLIERGRRQPCTLSVPILPNVRAVQEAAMRLHSTRDFIIGIKRQRFIGDGSEFESLREYEPGYDHRAIDWKASARRRKLLVREFEAERNHRIVLAFDTGYLMSQALGGIARLDHAIKAGLLLSLMSLRMGDRVGLFAFDQETRAYVEPQPGMPTLQRLMQHSARLEYNAVETNFTRGLAELGTRLRRRAIVVLLTDFADTVSAETLVRNLGQLSRRHLVI
ncbi:MAG: DUF58 domain-containing protein, partial [Myxococcota bacterium]|nr:DUF58 domain-containing protein [Myxococcota bacterium]